MKVKLLGALALGVMLVGAGGYWLNQQRELAHRYDCLSQLRSIGWALAMYDEGNGHAGLLPRSLEASSNWVSSARALVCPSTGKTAGSWSNVTEWADYFYVYWPSVKGVYTNYPVLYDRRMSNHGGKGINVLLADVVNTGGCAQCPVRWFWDEDARWLRKFVAEHPEGHVPLPADLK